MRSKLLVVSLLFSAACDPAPRPEVRVLDDFTARGGELVVNSATATAPRPGDIIVSALGDGLLRRVESVRMDGDDVALSTSPAVLTDAVENGRLSLHFATQPADGVILLEPAVQQALFDATFPIGDVTLVDHEDLHIRIGDGFVRFMPDFLFDVSISWGSLDEVTALLVGELDSELDVAITAEGPVTAEGESLLFTPYVQDFTVWLGPVPVTGELRIDIMAGYVVSTDAVGTLEARIGASADVTAGARYQDGAWA